jgi:hypothetical protein
MAALMSNALPFTGVAADLIVSTNDAKYARVVGHDTYPEHPPPDTLSVIDGTRYPPQVIATVEVETTVAGPPQAVAITPDGKIAVVSAPNRYDYAEKKPIFETFLQVVDLEAWFFAEQPIDPGADQRDSAVAIAAPSLLPRRVDVGEQHGHLLVLSRPGFGHH